MLITKVKALLVAGLLLPGVIQAKQSDMDMSMQSGNYETATFAGGCFWCVESDFDKVPGVAKTTSGYIGGHKDNPTYKEVSAGGTGHAEAVQIMFDSSKVSYQQLLDIFWHSIDPTTENSQFCDHGDQYRTAIFYHGAEQQQLAQLSKASLEKAKPFNEPIVTEISMATEFTAAEEYHQGYYKKNPLRYKFYRYSCGRDQRVEELWGKSNY